MDDSTLQLLARLDERSEHTVKELDEIKQNMAKLPREDTVKLTIAQGLSQHVASHHKPQIGSLAPLALKLGLGAIGIVGTALGIVVALLG
jgi:hypothetical protein